MHEEEAQHPGPSAGAGPGSGGTRAQHHRRFSGGHLARPQLLAAGCSLLLFPHLPCQAWPDGQL